jgi:hypothetical protein
MNIREKLVVMQTLMKAEKSRWNGFGKYNYRSAEDILEAVKPFLNEMSCSVTIEETLVDSGMGAKQIPLISIRAVLTDCETTEWVDATAMVGVDLLQKGMQVPQAFGAASSYGKKYALGNLFLIDDTKDSDGTNSHGKSTSSSKAKAKPILQGEALKKAKEAIKSGKFTIEAIQKKYEITPEVLKTL